MSFWVAGATVVGGVAAGIGSKRAADAQRQGADAATAETARQYDQTRSDLASGRSLYDGSNALIGRLLGIPVQNGMQQQALADVQIGDQMLPAGTTTEGVGNGWYNVLNGGQRIGVLQPGGANGRFTAEQGVDINALRQQGQQTQQAATAPGTPDMSSFMASPDYNFRRDEGMRGIERTAAARGGAFSGNALRALTDFNSNIASGEYGNYFNRLTTAAGLGSAATNQTAAYGADAASSASRNALFAGDARASGIQGTTNAIGGTLNGLAAQYGYGRSGGLSNSQFNSLVNPYQVTGAGARRI
jgi:hypothetical protein